MKRTEDGRQLHTMIEDDADGMKLEQYLRQRMHFTKTQISRMKFRENGMMVDGERVRISHVLRAGECLQLMVEEQNNGSGHLEQDDGQLEILYEDEDLIAVWKEAGLVVHPSHGHYRDTLSNRVHTYFLRKGSPVTVRSIGRLDRDTCGIVVFAKNRIAAARLWEQKENGIFWKEYLAVCRGRMDGEPDRRENEFGREFENETEREPEDGWRTISAPIGKLPGDLMRMCVSESGKAAVTHYRILRRTQKETLVQVRIETGRTHQIRVHMASIGHPLAGDPLYGTAGKDMFLCAWKAELVQPFSGEWIMICPHDFSGFCANRLCGTMACEQLQTYY